MTPALNHVLVSAIWVVTGIAAFMIASWFKRAPGHNPIMRGLAVCFYLEAAASSCVVLYELAFAIVPPAPWAWELRFWTFRLIHASAFLYLARRLWVNGRSP